MIILTIILTINLVMFNGFIAQKRRTLTRNVKQSEHKQAIIRKRYHTEVQPLLLDNYKKRLKSFIHKMKENPIVVNPQNLLPTICQTARFTFKNAEDWKSILPSRQRLEKQWHEKVMRRRKTLQKLQGSAYQYKAHDFRPRQKQKQLHTAMRYSTIEHLVDSARAKINRIASRTESKSKKTDVPRSSSKAENNGNSGGNLRETIASMSNNSSNKYQEGQQADFNYRGRSDNIEIEARLYQKRQELNEKKLHFKKLAEMALTTVDQHQKKQLREILRRTGFSKIKRVNLTESADPDDFLTLVEKASVK